MDDSCSPVVVGVGQLLANRDRTVEAAREPLTLLAEALRLAERDAGVPGLLAAVDSVHAVHVASWAYAGLAGQVARAVGASPRHLEDTGLGGHLPVRLLDRAAARVAAGESDVALLVGGEAQASVSLLGKAGVDPVAELGWSADPGGPPAFDLDQLGSAAMQAAGLIAPTRVYPLVENRLQADLGLTPAQSHAWSADLYAALSQVAADHPAAWNRRPLSAQEVATPSPANRLVCEPYPLSMNAMPHVDQAAAVVVTSLATARSYGLADDDLVHVRGGAGADDDPDVLARPDLGRSWALSDALARALAQAGLERVDLLDVYSCFPVVPKLVQLALGLPRDAAVSITGGHSSFGGPLNSYSLHALATVVEQLRGTARTALVHANGGYATYQHAVVLDGQQGGYVGDPEPRTTKGDVVVRPLADGDDFDVVVETATVEHGRDGAPAQAFLAARTPTGERVGISTPPGDAAAAQVLSLSALPAGATTHVGRRLRLRAAGGHAQLSSESVTGSG